MEHRRTFLAHGTACLGAAALASSLLPAERAVAQSAAPYPNRPIRVIVGYPPNGTTDVVARLIASKLQAQLGQPLIVENRPGADGGVGANAVAKATPDGYTLGIGALGNMALNYALFSDIPYDSRTDFEPLGLLARVTNVFAVRPKLPVRDVAGLIDYFKAKGGGAFASSHPGNGPHMTGELFRMYTGLDLRHAAHKGSAPAMIAVLGGDVDVLVDDLPSVLPFIQTGQLRAIAVSSEAESPSLPGVPSLRQQGLPDLVVDAWFALVAPAGVDDQVKTRIATAITAMAADTQLRSVLNTLGATADVKSAAELRKVIEAERDRWPRLVAQLKAGPSVPQ